MSAEDITARVQRGAALLDEKRPGWWRNIDLERLDVSIGCNCVAGQIGGFSQTMRSLELLPLEAQVAHGFEADDGGDESAPLAWLDAAADRDYAALTAAWRDLITARRETAGVTS